MPMRRPRWLLIGLTTCALVGRARAEEGLWTLEQVARPALRQKLGLPNDATFPEHLRENLVRFPSGVTGTVVSSRGLVMTVRRAVAPCLAASGGSGADATSAGFWAGTGKDLSCPGLSVETVIDSEDVTKKLRDGLAPGAAISSERIGALEAQCRGQAGVGCRVTALFHGAVMILERYRTHSDVRLVFAPEYRLAAFGTPTSRMVFPRYSLDVAFVRIYDQGKPLDVRTPTKLRSAALKAEDRVFVASYPRETERYLPWAYLKQLTGPIYRQEANVAMQQSQAVSLPTSTGQAMSPLRDATGAELAWSANRLRSTVALFQNASITGKLQLAEKSWRALVGASDPGAVKTAWAAAEAARSGYAKIFRRYLLIEGDRVRPFGDLFDVARKLVRLTKELEKPDGERPPEYRSSNLDETLHQLSLAGPFDADIERALIARGLLNLRTKLGARDPLVVTLGMEAPADTAARIVAGTRFLDPASRMTIVKARSLGEAASDPLVGLVQAVEAEAWPLRQRYDQDVQGPLDLYATSLGQRLAEADASGDFRYPDAGSDLRLSSGHVAGFLELRRIVPPQVYMSGLFQRGARVPTGSPWELPARWRERRDKVSVNTPINFVVDCDVGADAPGGAVFNQGGEVVGMVIGVTLKSAPNRLLYRGSDDRAVALHAGGIAEALRKIYDAGRLADELEPSP